MRTLRQCFGDLFWEDWPSLEVLQLALDERAGDLKDGLTCPDHGYKRAGRPSRPSGSRRGSREPFEVVVVRRVQRDCMVAFEGRRYSVPFRWING